MSLNYVNVNQDTTGLYAPQARATRTIAIVGTSTGGTANSPQLVTSASAAADLFGSGPLIDGVQAAFLQSPGPDGIWLVKESSTQSSVSKEAHTQGTAGNKEFKLANQPIADDVTPTVYMKVTPTINPSSSDDLGSYNQLGACSILFGGLDSVNNKALAVVTDQQHVAVPGAEVFFTSTGSTLVEFSAASAITDSNGYAEVTATPVDASGDPRVWAVTDEVTVASVTGDLDSASIGTLYDKDGSPDDDVVITYSATQTADKLFAWHSEGSKKVYAFQVKQISSDIGGLLTAVVSGTATLTNSGSNISDVSVTNSVYKTVGLSFTSNDAAAIYLGFGISETGTILNSGIGVTLDTLVSDPVDQTAGLGDPTAPYPVLHTYDLISAAGNGAMTSSTDYEDGKVYISQEPGLADILKITYCLNAFPYALKQLDTIDFHIIVGAGKTSSTNLKIIRDYIVSRQGGLTIIGSFMLDYKSKVGGNGLDVSMATSGQSSSIILTTHDDASFDVAAGVAGAAAGREPWKSLVMMDVAGVVNATAFTPTELDSLNRAQINACAKAAFKAGSGLVLTQGFSLDGTGQRTYIDIQRTLNYTEDLIKRALTNPNIFGPAKINRTGLEVVQSVGMTVLAGLVRRGAIEPASRLDIPLLKIVRKTTWNDVETAIVQAARNARGIDVDLLVEYAGSIHSITVNLKFTGAV